MKKILCIATIALMSFSASKFGPVDILGVKGPILFNNTRFHLTRSEKTNVDYYVQKYSPIYQTLERFNESITINILVRNISLEDAVKQKAGELNKRQETDKVCSYSITKDPDGKESIIDYVLSTEKNGELTTAEFTISRFKEIELTSHTKAILIYSYTKATNGKNIIDFFTNLPTDRIKFLDLINLQELPKIRIKE